MSDSDALQRLHQHYQSMPPVAAMDLRIESWTQGRLTLRAPLALHVNDKGCAFGGSLASMMTLASWGLVSLLVAEAGMDADIYVADSRIRYLAPLFADLHVQADLAPGSRRDAFLATLRDRGRARIGLCARALLPPGDPQYDRRGGIAADFDARYVAIVREAAPRGTATPGASG